jgi:hypothetical protein
MKNCRRPAVTAFTIRRRGTADTAGMRLTPFVALALLSLAAAPAFAKSDFPAKLDAACRAAGRVPPNPSELARATGAPYADCALCHDFDVTRGSFPTGSNDNADGAAYKRGNLEPFCVVPVVNAAPVLAPIGPQSVSVGQPLVLLLSASDVDGDPLVFSAAGLPNGALFMDGGNGMASFDWTPPQAGNYAVTFSVTDGMASDSERLVITAGNVNAPPVLAPIGDQNLVVGEMLTLAITATDPEGGALAFAATGLPAGATFQDFGDGSAELSFAASAAVVASVTVTVTDAGAPPESASETFRLTVEDPAGAQGPSLEYATWNLWEGELTVAGAGAPPDSLVTIVEPTSEGALAVESAGPNGAFEISARTFLAPCFVRARNADGVLGSPVAVMGAPRDCGQVLMTHAKPRWRCRDGLLSVRGSRAPVASDLTLLNAATGAALMTAQSDRRGRFRLALEAPAGPASVRLRMASGGGTWTLGPLAVSGSGTVCPRKDRDEDDD